MRKRGTVRHGGVSQWHRKTHRHNDQRRHTRPWVVRILFDETGINNEHHTIYCDGCLSDVRREDHFPGTLWCRLEDLGLHVTRQICVNWTDKKFRDFVPERSRGLRKVLLRSLDFVLTLTYIRISYRGGEKR